MENYTTVERQALMIIGIDCRTSNAPDAAPFDIPKLWKRFTDENIISQIAHRDSDDVFAVYCNYEGDYTKPYSVVIGCSVSSIDKVPKGMVAKIIPKATYALFQAIGEHPQSLIETWQTIWQSDLKRAYTFDYELYGKKFAGSPKEVEVYIALKK